MSQPLEKQTNNCLNGINRLAKPIKEHPNIEIIKERESENELLTYGENHIERTPIVNNHDFDHDFIEPRDVIAFKEITTKEKRSKSRPTLQFSLFSNFGFVAYCFTTFLYGIGFNLSVVFMAALAEETSLSKAASVSLVSVFGISDMIARIGASCLMDLRRLKPFRLFIFNAIIFGSAVLTSLMTSLHIYWHFALMSALFGLLTGAYISQLSVVLVDMLGVDSLTSSFGFMLFIIGLSGMVGPTVGGSLRDAYGSYHASFYFGTAGIVASGLTMAYANIWMYRHNRHKQH